MISALLITGSWSDDGAGNSVEVFIPSTGQHCLLPDIPGEVRWAHTTEQMTICGGFNTRTSCLTLTDGTWQTSTLREER